MIELERIKVALYEKLPSELQPQADTLAQLLIDVSQGSISPKDGEAQLAARADVIELLEALQGQKVETANTTLSFGHNNKFADVSIRDVAGRDIVTLTVNINYSQATSNKHFLKAATVINKNKLPITVFTIIISLFIVSASLIPTQMQTTPLELTPTALEQHLLELNIVPTVGSSEEIARARSFLKTDEYQAVAREIIEIMGKRRLKKPLQLDTIVGWHRINLNGRSDIIIESFDDMGNVEDSIVDHWNEMYGEAVTSLDQITEPFP